MSFILDALRKSETERQKQSAPGLVDTNYKPSEVRRNIWLPILAIILAANAIVVTILLVDDEDETAAEVAPVRPEPAIIQREPAPEVAASEVRPLYREPSPAPRVARTEPPVPASPARVSAPAPTPTPAPTSDIAKPADDETEILPSLQQLAVAGLLALPELHLDIHVFAGEPAKRFVYINSSKYREGDALKEGPRIERITETGAVLTHQGNRFTLERE